MSYFVFWEVSDRLRDPDDTIHFAGISFGWKRQSPSDGFSSLADAVNAARLEVAVGWSQGRWLICRIAENTSPLDPSMQRSLPIPGYVFEIVALSEGHSINREFL